MAKDAELDRLKVAQDLAFSRKQTAYDAQDVAWKRRKAAGDTMHAAFEEKDRAYHAQQSAWEDLQRLRDSKGPRIEQLNSLQERAFQNMKSSYDSASSAYDRRDGASAKSYAEQGRAYKAESQGYVEERRRLVAELRSAADNQKSYAFAFQAAKSRFDSAKREFDAAKATHERTQTEFKAAKAAFDKASSAFKARLDVVKAQNARNKNDKRSIAEKAGVPYQYLDKVYVSKDANGNTNIYFGGVGEPNGPGHGHYVVDRSGMVTYKREPFDPHGVQNFEGAGKDGHRGGFGKSQHGWIGDSPVTFALGWGTREGHTMIADGHLDESQFRDHIYHDHYGPGDGPNNNGTLRRKYTGPGA